ncbi:nitronate monooxygenase [Sutterella sp.]|uniref:nitronate monooxygenase n=1 Tax=Sutterella sp. TaxID=1981025 RepID=UPI0026DF2B93|nr:nitronate monooxygenase [Sutterella sp.]MDO5532597.1 nitronate monooxygenase [Sutterella sp.]
MLTLNSFRLPLLGQDRSPLMLGGMGTNISTAELVLALEKLGGIANLSDAMLMEVSDRLFGTRFTAQKAKRYASERDNHDKSAELFDLSQVREATMRYVSDVMSRATGKGLVLINCMEKLTMNSGVDALATRLNAALDAGIQGITLSAGLHLSSFKLMEQNPRFRDAALGIIVSSSRALNLFLRRSASTNRLPDYVVVEGPLAGGHLGFGMDWAEQRLENILRDVKNFLAEKGLNIPVIAAGGIFTGGEATKLLDEGLADGIQAATRFAVTQESGLTDMAKQAFFNSKPEDIEVNHLSPTGYPMRMLRQSPAITSDIRPNCEAYGYLLSHGECSYLKEWRERHAAMDAGEEPGEKVKCCLCTHMRNYKVWTCGATTSRLNETSVRTSSGEWILPTAEDVYSDYMNSTGTHIELPKAAKEYLKTAGAAPSQPSFGSVAPAASAAAGS